MIGSVNCTYETPCGWCSKWDKKCDRKIGTDTPAKISTSQFDENNLTVTKDQEKTVRRTYSDTAISANPKRCGKCDSAMLLDGLFPQMTFKCLLTNREHFYDDICDCDTITAAVDKDRKEYLRDEINTDFK